MRGKRTDTYYVYDAYTDELVGCGSLSKISELFEITPRILKKYAENGNLYASRNADNSTTLLHKEYYYSKKLAEQRIRYLQEFAAKRELGDFWYDNNYYDDIGRIVYVTRLKNGNNLIQSLDGVQTSKTDRAHYLDLLSFIQHEFIR